MKRANKLIFGLSALALCGVMAGGVSIHGFAITAFATDAPNAKKAATAAKDARKALTKRQAAKAVDHAEIAVANDPQNAEYRALLGQSYMLAGRFNSASQALNDALTLDPEDGRVALNLVLAKIAQGDWSGARSTLQVHADHIPASDRGLAFALAGDPVTAIEILTPAARAADATAKTRQNLALSLALAGRWSESREIAAMDVAPEKLNARILQWAQFSRPVNAYDQVASLLDVTPVQDGGQPVQLALSRQDNVAFAAAAPVPAADPVDAYMPGAPADVASQLPVEVAEAQPEPQQVAGTGASVVFGPRAEVVQQVPVRVAREAPVVAPKSVRLPKAEMAAAPKPVKAAKGDYFVQLGAYPNPAVARDAWARQTRRVPALSASTPQGAQIATPAGHFYRLSVGGFARSDANQLCRTVKASGGACFVRAAAGDKVASWAKPRTGQLASR